MKKTRLLISLIIVSVSLNSQTVTNTAKEKAAMLVKAMTLKEKIDYIGGYKAFNIRAIPRLGIPEIKMADGPQGIRNSTKSTLYPSGIAAAATWNRMLINKEGVGLGLDCRARGVHILLGPGVNIYRSPLCGRNFEYFGEDPYLTSEIAVQYIKGVQSEGVMATVKHYAANNQEYNRHYVSSDVDKRTLHEIYLETFRKAVQEAHVGAVMNSYNLINGVHATENEYLNIDVLRKMWGFEGILMSDWNSVYSAVGVASGGLDLEMPSAKYMNYKNIAKAIETGLVSESTIDLKVQHILQTLISFGFFDRVQLDKSIPEQNSVTEQIALDVAREGVVLLKNENNVLPLKGKTLVLGPNANQIPTGGGSGFVNPFTTISLVSGLKTVTKNSNKFVYYVDSDLSSNLIKAGEFFTDKTLKMPGLNEFLFKNTTLSGIPDVNNLPVNEIDYNWQLNAPRPDYPVDGFSARWTGFFRPKESGIYRFKFMADDGYRMFFDGEKLLADWNDHALAGKDAEVSVEAGKLYPVTLEYYDAGGDAVVTFSYLKVNESDFDKQVKDVDNIVLNIGLNSNLEGEDFDRPFSLPQEQLNLLEKLLKYNKKIVVVLNAGGAVEMNSWINKVQGLIMAWYPGQQGGQALAEILTGKLSPSGKLPISIEKKADDNPTFGSYYDDNPKAIHKRVQYNEGVFLGYKGYDKTGVEPLFPFGYGLSYSIFVYSNLRVEKSDGNRVVVQFDVKNTGKADAAEIAQVYVGDLQCSVPRPEKELKGFEKIMLKKGETKTVSVELRDDAFWFFDVTTDQFVVEPGDFKIMVGSSSKDIRLSQVISL